MTLDDRSIMRRKSLQVGKQKTGATKKIARRALGRFKREKKTKNNKKEARPDRYRIEL